MEFRSSRPRSVSRTSPARSSGFPLSHSYTETYRPVRFPASLQGDSNDSDDVTAPRTARGRLLNQSFISLIANVGSNASFNPRFQSIPREDNTPAAGNLGVEHVAPPGQPHRSHLSLRRKALEKIGEHAHPEHRSRTSSDVTASLPGLAIQKSPSLSPQEEEAMTTSQILARPPPMSLGAKILPWHTVQQKDEEAVVDDSEGGHHGPIASGMHSEAELTTPVFQVDEGLAARLAGMFGFDSEEAVVAEFPCWLLQNVLLQGYMYITRHHICFYAFLPRYVNTIVKSGHLAKRGRQNPKYNRYWFILKGDVLSYYTNPKDLYFPRNTIDLRSATAAQLQASAKDDPTTIAISTAKGSVYLRAESATSAREWLKQIQKVIFRCHNDGDSVKICIPVTNIEDIEDNPVMDFADTFRIRILDGDDTFAIDEYFFSFFGHGTAVREVLERVLRESAREASAPAFHQDDVDDDAEEYRTFASKDHGRMDPLAGSQILQNSTIFQRPTIRHSRHRRSIHSRSVEPFAGNHETGSSARGSSKKLNNDGQSRLGSGLPAAREESPPSLVGQEIQDMPRPTSSSSTTVDNIRKASSYPFQKASELAGIVHTQSRKVRTLLGSGSSGYYEKVSSMLTGKRGHVEGGEGGNTHDAASEADDDADNDGDPGDRFRAHFSLPDTEKLQAAFFGYLHRVVPIYGKLYVGEHKVCFRSLLPGTHTIMILPMRDIENLDKEKGFRFGYSGLVLAIRGHEELFFEFSKQTSRDECAITILRSLDAAKDLAETRILPESRRQAFEAAQAEDEYLKRQRASKTPTSKPSVVQSSSESSIPSQFHPGDDDEEGTFKDVDLTESGADYDDDDKSDTNPILFDDTYASMIDFRPRKSQNIVCLTIGSRGDVQPYIALCKGLMADGHHAVIATHAEFEDWIRGHGIEFRPVAGDPAEIMRLCVENDMFTVSFFREALSKFKGWVDDLLRTSWDACQGADILIESPSAMAGIHVAEALQIPYFRAFTMPWTRTRAYPHAFAVPSQKMGGNYNTFSYVMFDNVFWTPIAGQINRWRNSLLGLPNTTLDKMQANKVPFLYNFSPSVVAPPLDFNQWIRVTGYWFLDEGRDYKPPSDLVEFIARCRKDKKRLVYVGFGSMVVEDPAALTRTVVDSVEKAGVCCILSKGWSDRLGKPGSSRTEVPLPSSIFQIKSAPHDWLFAQVDAAAHHGGAGTTGASLRAGIPTIVKPFFGDQFFFGGRVEDLGVGRCLKVLNTGVLARALWEVTHSERMIVKARKLGERIRSENGVQTAIQAIYRDLEYAKSLIKRRKPPAQKPSDESTDEWTLVDE